MAVDVRLKVTVKPLLTNLNNIKKNVVSETRKLHQKIAEKGKGKAIELAPVGNPRLDKHSGILKKNIKAQKFKTFSRIISFINHTGFPYNLWVEGIIPSVRLKPPYGDGKQQVRYGRTASFNNTRRKKTVLYNWTGKPRFFTITKEFLEGEIKTEIKKIKIV